MGTPVADRVREHFERQRNAGFVQIRVWVPTAAAHQVRELAARLVAETKDARAKHKRAKSSARQAAWESKHPPKQCTRQQAIEALAADLDDSVEELVESMGSGLDEVLVQFAARRRLKIVN